MATAHAVTDARDYAVLLSADVQAAPAQIQLLWAQDTFTNPTSYIVSRKAPTATAWTALATLSGTETNYVDADVAVGGQYEYQVQKVVAGYSGYGYVLAGIEAPLVEDRGKVVLLVDNTYAAELAAELSRLQQDLVGDGWQVVRHDVDRNDTAVNVKALIKADYAADPANVRSVFIFGHVPVPYSGDIVPDGHTPNHRGAWPADVYYADVDTDWNDKTINSTNATDPRNINRPGDGKFDMSTVTTLADLEVGRVDLADLPAFALPEKELLRQYLNKDHNFRHKVISAQPRGLVCDNFGTFSGSAFAATGWRNFAAMFGAANVFASSNWCSAMQSESFLWGYGCGGGTYTSVAGVTTTTELAANDPQVVFTFLFGSYFGDWDTPNNVMRAALATPSYTLTSAWGGRPHWFVHHMGLGNTIGRSTRLSQNNTSGSPYKQINAGALQVHVALMGDPTLRLHPVAPPTALVAAGDTTQVTLTWSPSAEAVVGYQVYRATNAAGPFARISASPVTGNSYVDTGLSEATYTYLVRAVKLQASGSGTYYNASQGAFATVTVAAAALTMTPVADQTVELGSEWTFVTPYAASPCGSVTVIAIATATNATCGGCFVATRVWQATDGCGESAFTTNVVTIVDSTAPAVSFDSSVVIELGLAWEFTSPQATDAGGAAAVVETSTVTNAGVGNTLVATRTWAVTDHCGNVTEASQTITVQDTTPPLVTIQAEKVVELGDQWNFDQPSASDLGGEVTVSVGQIATNAPRAGTASIVCTWTATDPSGNAAECSQTVTVQDTTAPTLAVPADKTVEAGAEWDFDLPIASDLSGEVVLAIASTVTNGIVQTRTWNATDSSGNVTTGSQSVTVQPAVPPTISLVAVDDTAAEGGDKGKFVIAREGSTHAAATINLSYSGQAINGVDYELLPATITIPAGAVSVELELAALTDALPEKVELARVSVVANAAYLLGPHATATVKIADVTAKRK